MILIFTLAACGGGQAGGSQSSITDDIDSGDQSTIYRDSVTLSWDEPLQNIDGSPVTDLSGYKVHYGTTSGTYSQSSDVGSSNGAVITDLTPGTWCFAVTAYDSVGNESGYSEEICTTI